MYMINTYILLLKQKLYYFNNVAEGIIVVYTHVSTLVYMTMHSDKDHRMVYGVCLYHHLPYSHEAVLHSST